MIEQVNISNFRCFRRLEIKDLNRINLVVGENSSGKTAFLESLFLSSGTMAPNVVFQMRGIRRMGNQMVVPKDARSYRGLWEDLFYDFHDDKKLSIRLVGRPDADSRSLAAEYVSDSRTHELPFERGSRDNESDGVQQSPGLPQIEFTWKRHGHPQVTSRPILGQNGMQFEVAKVDFFPCAWFSPGVTETPHENAQRFSDLDVIGRAQIISAVLSREFDFIEGLSIDYHAGVPMIFARLKGKERKLPIPLVSDGVNRLVGICLGLASFAGGTILIDQLEDGFHYKLLPSIWKSLYTLAVEFDVQLFITTHSNECIRAVAPVLCDHIEDFRLLRTLRQDKGCTIDVRPGRYLGLAVEQDFEVR